MILMHNSEFIMIKSLEKKIKYNLKKMRKLREEK